MRLFARRGGDILTLAMLIATFAGLGGNVFAQNMEKNGVAVYVAGGIPDNEKQVFGACLLAALADGGHGAAADGADSFFAAAMEEERSKNSGLSKERICELGRQFNIRRVCAVSVVSAFGVYSISARIIDTETGEALHKGDAQSPLKTADDLALVSGKIMESMFGAQTKRKPESAAHQSEKPDAVGAVSLAGDAKAAADKVVAAAKAFKDATDKSMEAANAVKAATQSKNFSAIKEAKKKLEEANEAVNRAKADVASAMEALKEFGPEAEAAVKALGIDLAMFGGSGGSEGTRGKNNSRNDAAGEGEGADAAQKKKNRRPRIGVNGLYANSVGDNIRWKESGEVVSMPYSYGGAYFYYEWMMRTANRAYSEIHLGFAGGGGKWESAAASDKGMLPDVGRSIFMFGSSMKWPFGVKEEIKVFPMYATECEMALSASMNGKEYKVDGKTFFSIKGWLYLGGGADYDLSERVYLRVEALYGYSFSLDGAVFAVFSKLDSRVAETDALSRGLALRVGVGFKL